MSPVRYDDLPRAVRARVDKLGETSAERASTPARRRAPGRAVPRPRWNRYRCAACGHRESAWAAAERHADETGHARIVLVLEGAS